MKKTVFCFVVFAILFFFVCPVRAESVNIEEIAKLVRSLNEKSRKIPLGEAGWIFFRFDRASRRRMRVTNCRMSIIQKDGFISTRKDSLTLSLGISELKKKAEN